MNKNLLIEKKKFISDEKSFNRKNYFKNFFKFFFEGKLLEGNKFFLMVIISDGNQIFIANNFINVEFFFPSPLIYF